MILKSINQRQSISHSDQGKNKGGMEKNQNNKIRNVNGEITTDNKETQKAIRDCCGELQVTKMDNIEEM